MPLASEVHTSDARLFVGSRYYELRTRSNKLYSWPVTSGEIMGVGLGDL